METSNSSLIVILMEERERRFWIFCFFYHLPFKHLKHTPLTPVDQQELQYWTHCIVWMNFLSCSVPFWNLFTFSDSVVMLFGVKKQHALCYLLTAGVHRICTSMPVEWLCHTLNGSRIWTTWATADWRSSTSETPTIICLVSLYSIALASVVPQDCLPHVHAVCFNGCLCYSFQW